MKIFKITKQNRNLTFKGGVDKGEPWFPLLAKYTISLPDLSEKAANTSLINSYVLLYS